MRKSYEVLLSPENKLCNSVVVLTEVIRTVISDIQVWIIRTAKTLICCCFTDFSTHYLQGAIALYPGFSSWAER